jgi:hypothetical protein
VNRMTDDTVPTPFTDEEIEELLADIEKDEQGVPLMDATELRELLSGTNGHKASP